MSVTDPVGEKSSSECEIKDEDELRISNIEGPSNDESPGLVQPEASVSDDNILEIFSDTTFSNEYKTCGDGDSLPEPQPKFEDNLDINSDSQNATISAIDELRSTFTKSLQDFSVLSKETKNSFPRFPIEKFQNESPSLADKSTPSPLLLFASQEGSPFESSSSSFNLIGNKSPSSAVSQAFDIPLPEQNVDDASSPKPESIKKSPNSDSSMKISFDSPLNINLSKSDMDLDSCETAEPADNSLDGKSLTPVMDVSDMDLGLDSSEKKSLDSSRYSPNRLDSDEENQEFTTTKPKVLGKEQAKKRLMAFSLSRQSGAPVVKKQNKLMVPQKGPKEKPPNPNKSVGVQEQFRATITAIEEEKKKMMQNMPDYLLMYTNSLANVGDGPVMNPAEKSIKDAEIDINAITKMIMEKNEKDEVKSKCSQSSPNKSRSSVSRSKRQETREKRENDEKNDDLQLKKIESIHSWKSFTELGFALDPVFWRLKFRYEEKQKQKNRNKRFWSPDYKALCDYKPIFDYLTGCPPSMAPLKAKTQKPGQPASFKEKTVKYTMTKPAITWAENQRCATDFYMPKQMLLENCDKCTSSILYDVMHQRGETCPEVRKLKQRNWYPQFDYLTEGQEVEDINDTDENSEIVRKKGNKTKDDDDDDSIERENSSNLEWNRKVSGKETELNWELEQSDLSNEKDELGLEPKDFPIVKSRERRVNRNYSSDEGDKRNPVKQLFVGDMKVQLDIGLNSVKVKSKWDSDYDDDDDDKDSWNGIEKLAGKRTSLGTHEEYGTKSLSANGAENLGNPSDVNAEHTSNQANSSVVDLQNPDFSFDGRKGKLASEYEKFMRLVSCDVDNVKDQHSSESPFDKLKKRSTNSAIHLIMSDSKNSKNIDPTDWDLESDREEKLPSNNMDSVKGGTANSFSMLLSGYDGKTRRKSKSPGRKKSGKYKSKDKSNKSSKNKKKKNKGKSSSDSSSDSSDSGSDSDSSDSEDKKRKKKRKRTKKYKKKYSSSSSSSSTSSSSSSSSSGSSSSDSKSDSDDNSSKSKKNRHKKKRKRTKKNVSGESSGSNDETGAAMLQQLDLKKQQLIKKIEEIDSLDVAANKKKKGSKAGKDEKFESEIGLKAGKRTGNAKGVGYFEGSNESTKESDETVRIQKTLEKFDGTQSGDEIGKEKKEKKGSKKQKWSSESSTDGEEKENRRTKSAKKSKRNRKKKAEYSSSSETDSSSDSRKKKYRKKKKKKEGEQKPFTKNTQEMPNWNDHLLSDESDCKSESVDVGGNLSWINNKRDRERRERDATDNSQKDCEGLKDLGDWENSSVEESPKDRRSRESTWDEELPVSGFSQPPKDDTKKDKEKNDVEEQLIHDDRNNFINEFNLESKRDLFTESSDSNLDPKGSRESYSRENSSSTQLFRSITGKNCNLDIGDHLEETLHVVGNESRKDKNKPSKDELYSPGHTDSDLSDENERGEYCRESRPVHIKQEIYDPDDSGSEVTDKRDRAEENAVPLLPLSNILLPEEMKKEAEEERLVSGHSVGSSLPRSDFIAIPLAKENEGNKNIPSAPERAIVLDFTKKKSAINVKLQQKLQSKVASVFQSDSEDEVEVSRKNKTANIESEPVPKEKTSTEEENAKKDTNKEDKKVTEERSCNEKSRRRSKDRGHKSRWNSDSHKENSEKRSSSRRRSPPTDPKNLDPSAEKWNPDEEDSRKKKGVDRRSPRSKTDNNSENGLKKSDEVTEKETEKEADVVRPIPVLTGLDVRMSDGFPWNRSHMLGSEDIGFSCDHLDLMSPNLDSFKLYGSPDGKSEAFLHDTRDRGFFGRKYERNYGHDIQGSDMDVLMENRIRVDKRKSRSRSGSPRKRRRSKTPDRRRSPRTRSPKRRSTSPRRRGRSPFSPRRRGSPRGRRYKTSRSPERKKSRSPRKGRHTPSRRSRSISPRKHKDRPDSPRRRSISPGKDGYREIGVRNLIHLTGMPDDENRDLGSARYDSPMGFTRSLADSTISDSELNSTFYSRDYPGEYGSQNYPEDVTVNNLITVQNHDADKQTDSPKRLPLDQRLELELGVPAVQNDQYPIPPHQSYEQFPEHGNQYPNSYQCDDGIPHTSNGSQNFYSTQNSEFNGQFFNGQPGSSSSFDQYQQYPCHNQPPPQNSVLQVGNIMEVVPTLQSQLPPPTMLPPSKGHQIMQVGNVLQVVPSPKPAQPAPFNYGANPTPGNSQQPVPLHFDKKTTRELLMSNPIVRAIILEKERRKREKEKRKMERDARRKARQQKREAKMMSVNEKLKKSVQDEGLMLGQEVEEDGEDDAEHPSPPVPVEIVTDSSQSSLPPAGKGILITAGFIPRPASEKKEVKFADGVCPGEGTSTSEGEDQAAPAPKPKLPKEKRYKKKKPKVKKKVKVHIIKQVVQDDEDEEEDDLPPPPPPPGDPPPGIFYVKFRNGKVQYPIYRKQTTTTTFTTVQFPPENIQ